MGYLFYQLVVLLVLLLSVVSCNPSGEYYPKDSVGTDLPTDPVLGNPGDEINDETPDTTKAICLAAVTESACGSLSQICQPAFQEVIGAPDQYYACVPKLDENPATDPIVTPPVDETDPKDPVVTNPTEPTEPKDPVVVNPPKEPTEPKDPVVVTPEPDKEPVPVPTEPTPTPGTKDPVVTNPPCEPKPLPEIEGLECRDIDAKYLVRKGQGQTKVVICHKEKSHPKTLVIACPAYQAHVDHHEDKLGPCL